MAYNKGLHHSSNGGSHVHRGRSYALILLITFGVALLGVMVLHKLRERRIYTLLVKEKDNQILALQLLLQKERDRSKELRGKNEEMKGKIYTLRSQKMELSRTVGEMQSTLDSLKDEQKLMESAFVEQQKELRLMQEKASNVGQGGSEIVAIRDNLKHKEAEIEDLKRREIPVNDHPTTFPEIVTTNGTTAAAEDETEKDENSGESAKYEGDDSEDASKSKLTEFKDGEVRSEIKDKIRTYAELVKENEDTQDDGGDTGKDAEVVDGREKETTREEHAGLENNIDDGGQVKQLAVMKRKHGHARRTKGKRFKGSSIENNGVSDKHTTNRKVYRDEFKGRRVGKVSREENFAREDGGRDNNSARKVKSQAKLLKPENHESKEANYMKVNKTNHHINKAHKNAGQTKSKGLLEGQEELEEVLGVQKQEKGAIDSGHDEEDSDEDFFKESQPDFEDEKDEYKEEIDQSEFQPGL
ncbi:hypothetical protein VNO78_06052 [Psophocarpus tetragonolobus]|uniref:Micronuclear linker histone polyprotein-like protein n=1 Tax=Psophocarpus tetragonolobus TaxID=3891 RepID=A0AAN9XRA8_PSOTE